MGKAIAFFIVAVALMVAAVDANMQENFRFLQELRMKLSLPEVVCSPIDMRKVEEIIQECNAHPSKDEMENEDEVKNMYRLAGLIIEFCVKSIDKKVGNYASTKEYFNSWLIRVARQIIFPIYAPPRAIKAMKERDLNPKRNLRLKDSIEENYTQEIFQNDLCKPLEKGGELFDHFQIVEYFLEGKWAGLRAMREIMVLFDHRRVTNFYCLGVVCENIRKRGGAWSDSGAAPSDKEEASASASKVISPEQEESSENADEEEQPITKKPRYT